MISSAGRSCPSASEHDVNGPATDLMNLRMKLRIRRALRLATAALSVTFVVAADVHADDSLASLADDCQNRLALQQALQQALKQESDGAELFSASVCPQFTSRLRESQWQDTLFGTTPDTLTIEQVREFSILTERYTVPSAGNPSLSRQSLVTILRELPQPEVEQRSAWQHIRDWLKEQFEAQSSTDLPTLIKTFTGWIEARWMLAFIQVALCAAALAAVFVFIRELRRAGVLGRPGRTIARSEGGAATTPANATHPVPLRLQPAVLLNAVVARLQGDVLPSRAFSMTVQEIQAQQASLPASAQQQLSKLASGTERIAYADWHPDDIQLRELVRSGETLLQDLSQMARR